jgi:hypothetical protein
MTNALGSTATLLKIDRTEVHPGMPHGKKFREEEEN